MYSLKKYFSKKRQFLVENVKPPVETKLLELYKGNESCILTDLVIVKAFWDYDLKFIPTTEYINDIQDTKFFEKFFKKRSNRFRIIFRDITNNV